MDAVRRKRPEKWRSEICFLFHDNAPAHRSVLAKDFLRNNNVTTLEIPPYSCDLAAAYFCLFTRIISALEGWRFCECDERAEKSFTKWLPGMFPTTLQSLAEVYNCRRGIF
jgi:hypothetical protein